MYLKKIISTSYDFNRNSTKKVAKPYRKHTNPYFSVTASGIGERLIRKTKLKYLILLTLLLCRTWNTKWPNKAEIKHTFHLDVAFVNTAFTWKRFFNMFRLHFTRFQRHLRAEVVKQRYFPRWSTCYKRTITNAILYFRYHIPATNGLRELLILRPL